MTERGRTPRAAHAGDVRATLLSFAALMAWDASGWDLQVARWFGSASGFALRDAWWASHLLHDGGRLVAWLLLAVLALNSFRRKAHAPQTPGAAERRRWLGVMLLCVAAVPALKHFSITSCPWDLAEFGGTARHVSHWAAWWRGVADGGGGRCFPSGHAVAAFGFVGQYFLWRGHDARRAHWWLCGVAVAGLLFGTAQLVRGAHYPSHTLWSAWLCWTVCAAADALRRGVALRPNAARATP